MRRRSLVTLLRLVPLELSITRIGIAAPHGAAEKIPPRILNLVELVGGNDGLNTVVPFSHPAYYNARPRLSIASDSVLRLSDDLITNPALEGPMESWSASDFAVVLGVGYPEPNRYHFRSIDIWETASRSGLVESLGWISQLADKWSGLIRSPR